MSDKVEEEVPLRDRDDFVCNFDEERESLGRSEVQPLADRGAKVFGPGAGVNLERLVGVVGKVDLSSKKILVELGFLTGISRQMRLPRYRAVRKNALRYEENFTLCEILT